ncbi:hypothetical protein Q9L58_010567 [Maublancomyces gigas]|uniref:Uncharacterized protein n=1 Tax=Discina gigas TaxID=1032678 RepID=A0ABR3G3T3_9PEZI
MIDSGTSRCFIRPAFAALQGSLIDLLANQHERTVIDGPPIASGAVFYTTKVAMNIFAHIELLTCFMGGGSLSPETITLGMTLDILLGPHVFSAPSQ